MFNFSEKLHTKDSIDISEAILNVSNILRYTLSFTILLNKNEFVEFDLFLLRSYVADLYAVNENNLVYKNLIFKAQQNETNYNSEFSIIENSSIIRQYNFKKYIITEFTPFVNQTLKLKNIDNILNTYNIHILLELQKINYTEN